MTNAEVRKGWTVPNTYVQIQKIHCNEEIALTVCVQASFMPAKPPVVWDTPLHSLPGEDFADERRLDKAITSKVLWLLTPALSQPAERAKKRTASFMVCEQLEGRNATHSTTVHQICIIKHPPILEKPLLNSSDYNQNMLKKMIELH